MTLPNGAGGINIPDGLSALLFPTSGPGQPKARVLSGRYDLTRELVEAGLKNDYVLENPAVQLPLASVYEEFDLPPGTPLALAIMTVLARQFLGLPAKLWTTVTGVLADIQPWVENIPGLGDLVELITGIPDGDPNDLGTFFLNIRNFLAGINFLDPAFNPVTAVAQFVNLMLLPLNLLLGPASALNAANLFGRIQMPQLAGGVSLADLTTATANLLDPFTAAMATGWTDGWSYNATEDAAQVICDGSTKGLWLKSGVIKVEEGQPVNTSIKVKYSGVTSGAGQTIRYVLETYESEDGSGPMVPVIVDAITNPSGTITSPVTLGDTSWDPPPGVQSVRPLLESDELVTVGTVYWLNTPVFRKVLLGVLADGLPKAIQDRIDDIQDTWNAFKGSAGGTVADIQTALDAAGQGIRDAIANAMGHAGTGHTTANILTYLMNIPQTVVSGLEDGFADADDAIADVFDDVRDGWNKFWDGIFKTTGSTGKTAADVQTAAAEVINTATAAHVSIDSANAAVATWQSQFTQQQMAQPLWLTGADGTCEVTIPLAWCHYWPNPEDGGHNSFALSCGAGSHSHPVNTIPIVLDEFKVESLMASLEDSGDFIGGVMRCRGGDLKDTITTHGVVLGDGWRLVIYEMDVTDGSLSLLYESATLTAPGGSSPTPIVHELPAGSEFITTVGQVLVVGAWIPGTTLAYLAGSPISQGYNATSTAFPKSIGVRDTGWSSNAPASMNDGDFTYMTFDSTAWADLRAAIVPFFGLGSASPPAPLVRRRFTSQFGTAGVADWVNVTGPFGTISGELSSTALAAGVYKDPVATDSPAVEIHLSPTKTVGKTRIAVKSNADMSKWIGVEFDRTSSTAMTAKIITGTGPDSGLTTRFTSANVGNNYGPIEVDPVTGTERIGGARFRLVYTQASNTYELFLFNPLYYSWSSLGTWVDSGGFTSHGLAYRYGGAITGVSGSPNKGQAVTQVSFYDA